MISSFINNQSNQHPLSSRNVLKSTKPTTSVFQIATKNTFHVQESSREFGKDITNVNLLTVSMQNENVNTMNISKQSESVLEKKFKNLTKQKDDLTQKLKNYDIKVQTFKHPMRSQTLRSSVTQKSSGDGEELSDISMRYSNIVNNDIITGECLGKYGQGVLNKAIEEINDDRMAIDEERPQSSSPERDIKVEEEVNVNPQVCKDYIKDIHSHLRAIELNFLPKPTYMCIQTDVNDKMRGILIDWLIEVHLKYKLVPETMFLTINLIDRYLSLKPTMRNKLQLVGVTSMFIACKYEEIFAPEVGDFVYITDNAYKKAELIQMESDILQAVNYDVTVPSPYRFLELYNNYLPVDQTIFYFAWYLIELTLVDIKMLKYPPSLLAAGAFLISLKLMKMYSENDLDKVTGYTEDMLKECSRDICALLQNSEKASLQAIKKKFSLSKYLEVSKIKYL